MEGRNKEMPRVRGLNKGYVLHDSTKTCGDASDVKMRRRVIALSTWVRLDWWFGFQELAWLRSLACILVLQSCGSGPSADVTGDADSAVESDRHIPSFGTTPLYSRA
jgi:hypothetical protein